MRTGRRRLWYLLLVAPFVGLLWVRFYARATPEVFGFPFFYWYQFLWVPLTALITVIVYSATRPRPGDERGSAPARDDAGRRP